MTQSLMASAGLFALPCAVKRVLAWTILGLSLRAVMPLFAIVATVTSSFTVSTQVIASCALSTNLLQTASGAPSCKPVKGLGAPLPPVPRTFLQQDGKTGAKTLVIEF